VPEQLETVLDDLAFGEGPRWHDGRLYFSDMHSQRVLALAPDGTAAVVAEVPNDPSGLGWLPDGRMLVVSMRDRRVLRQESDGSLALHADLWDHAPFHCNDMVVDAEGRAYVGNFGFDLHGLGGAGRGARPTAMHRVDPDGSVHVAADDMSFPNGAVITPDGGTLIVGETMAGRLTAFTIADDGALTDRRVFAQLDGAIPDGICLDAEGAIWLACPLSGRVLRVAEGGRVLQTIDAGRGAFACALGDADGRSLYVLTASTSDPDECVARRDGRLERIRVDVPGRPT
jgi:sugar lactone lactonase YvrE